MPGMELTISANHADPNSHKSNKIQSDVCIYTLHVRVKGSTPTQYRYVQIQIEFKPNEALDPFVHHEKKAKSTKSSKAPSQSTQLEWEAQAAEREKVRGQAASYIAEQYQHQNRCFVFSAVVSGGTVRFYRWDRAGAIVTERVDYQSDPATFCEFLWRFAHMSDVQRGWDPTVRPANADEIRIAQKELSAWGDLKDRKYPVLVFWVPTDEVSILRKYDGPVYRASAGRAKKEGPPADGKPYRKFIAWRPIAISKSPTGRSTYGYPVWEAGGCGIIMFLKGQWRTIKEGMETEGAILLRLNGKDVQHVPPFVCGGHLEGLGQITETQNYTGTLAEATNRVLARQHYRLIAGVVASPISCFTSSRQMMTAMYHAFIGERTAIFSDHCR